MECRRLAMGAAALALMAVVGCGEFWGDESSRSLVGVRADRAYVQYYAKWSGFETLPSSMWKFDLPAATTERLHKPQVQYDVQMAGDYYVAERPKGGERGSRIVATHVTTGDEIVILARDVSLGGRYDRAFAVDGQNVVARTSNGLLIYDLSGQVAPRAVALDAYLVEIHAAGNGRALVRRDSVQWGDELLVDLETGAAVTIPDPSDGLTPLFFDAAFADDYVFTGGFHTSANDVTDRATVLALHIPTLTWQPLVSLDALSADSVMAAFARGADETYVLAEFLSFSGDTRMELIRRDSGERTIIAEKFDVLATPFGAQLQGGRVYWIDELTGFLVVYGVASGTRTALPLEIPK